MPFIPGDPWRVEPDKEPARFLIWGCGRDYMHLVNDLLHQVALGEMTVAGVTADDLPCGKTLDGFPLIQKEEALGEAFRGEYDYILVTALEREKEMIAEAVSRGIPREALVTCRVLYLPHLRMRAYIALKESRISIVSNYCWGGLASRTLGLEHLSPFKNLFFEDTEYLRLLAGFREYMAMEPVIDGFRGACFESPDKLYPVLKLGDIRVYCNHTTSAVQAISDWRRRCQKINYDRIFVQFTTEYRDHEEAFHNLDLRARRMAFVPYDTEWEDSFRIYALNDRITWCEFANATANGGGRSHPLDLVKLMSGQRPFTRIEY